MTVLQDTSSYYPNTIIIPQTLPNARWVINQLLSADYEVIAITHQYIVHYPDGITKTINKDIKEPNEND